MKNKVSVKIEKVILPLHLEDNFELISCDDARLILQWRYSDKEVMIECSLEQLDSNRGLLHFDGDDFVHLNAIYLRLAFCQLTSIHLVLKMTKYLNQRLRH